MIYNYITTNNLNGKQYVGMHSSKQVDDGYLGSGKYLLNAIKKYGKENFSRDIICFCADVSIAHYNEGIYIIEYNTLAPNGYNISPSGGVGGLTTGGISNFKGRHHSDESKKKSSESHKGFKHTAKSKRQMSKSHKGKTQSKESNDKRSKKLNGRISPMKGRQQSNETKQKISINSGSHKSEVRNKISASLKGIKRGIMSDEHKQHIRESKQRKYSYDG